MEEAVFAVFFGPAAAANFEVVEPGSGIEASVCHGLDGTVYLADEGVDLPEPEIVAPLPTYGGPISPAGFESEGALAMLLPKPIHLNLVCGL